MHRIFLIKDVPQGSSIDITDDAQIHHMRDVVRLRPGEKVTAVDREGSEYICKVAALRPQVRLEIIKSVTSSNSGKNKASVAIACALPKNSNFDDIVDKLTQLGVDTIIPFESQRVVVKLDEKKKEQKHSRWIKIATSASQQCQRNKLPRVDAVRKLADILRNSAGYDLKLIPTVPADRLSLAGAVRKNKPKSILVLVGPEGDFSDAEIALAERYGFLPVSLGDLVLRVETAAVAVASFLLLDENV